MTEKRFTFNCDSDWWTISDNTTNDERLWGQDVVDLLNELDKENRKLKNEFNLSKLNLKEKNEGFNKLHKMYMKQIEENKELKKQLGREENDKKRLMSFLIKYKGYIFDEIVEDILDEPYYDNWWEDGLYEYCWKMYLKEKGFDGDDI